MSRSAVATSNRQVEDTDEMGKVTYRMVEDLQSLGINVSLFNNSLFYLLALLKLTCL